MSPHIEKVQSHPNFTLTVSFKNGETRRFDMKPYLEKGIFRSLNPTSAIRRRNQKYLSGI